MSVYYVVDPIIGAQGPASLTGTVQNHPIGLRVKGEDKSSGGTSANVGAGQFVYCRGSDVTAIGQFVQISNSSAVLLAAANSTAYFPVGVAAGNLSASNVFGWVQVEGLCDYARGTNSSIGAGVNLYVCAGTSGLLVTNVVAGNRVQGIVANVSYTSSQSKSLSVQLMGANFFAGLTASL
jgi:hypothetical protein